jgi:hypothetical protein
MLPEVSSLLSNETLPSPRSTVVVINSRRIGQLEDEAWLHILWEDISRSRHLPLVQQLQVLL